MTTPAPATPTTPPPRTLRVLLLCTGVGIMNRGIESFFREAYDGLHGTPGLDVHLLKGGPGPTSDHEHRTFVLPRTGAVSRQLGKLIKRTPYVVEQLSALPGAIKWLRRHRPDVIFYSDCNIMMRLYAWRDRIGVPFKTVLSNGGPLNPPFSNVDLVQQVAPFYYDEALAAGEPPARHITLPYGISVPPGDPPFDPAARLALRQKLGLPPSRPIVLSVGWIAEAHKRMHHVIREVASIPQDRRPYLVLLGNIDDASPPIFKLAESLLGPDNHTIRSVPYEQVADFYRAADLFTLCSLKEGFGRVYIEALMHGLPAIVHPHPVMQFVLGDEGTFVDMNTPGPLAAAITATLATPLDAPSMARRRASVRTRFGWENLAPAYRSMFQRAVFGQTTPS